VTSPNTSNTEWLENETVDIKSLILLPQLSISKLEYQQSKLAKWLIVKV